MGSGGPKASEAVAVQSREGSLSEQGESGSVMISLNQITFKKNRNQHQAEKIIIRMC